MGYGLDDFVGNVGVILILLAYLGMQTKRLSPDQLSYSVLNGLGALLILVSLYFSFNLSAFIIEVFWLLISVYGVWRYFYPVQVKDTSSSGNKNRN